MVISVLSKTLCYELYEAHGACIQCNLFTFLNISFVCEITLKFKMDLPFQIALK